MRNDLQQANVSALNRDVYINNTYKQGCISPDQNIVLCLEFEIAILPKAIVSGLSLIGTKKYAISHKSIFHTKYGNYSPAINGNALDDTVIANEKYSHKKIVKAYKKYFQPLDKYIMDGIGDLLEYAMEHNIKVAISTNSNLFDLVEEVISFLGFSKHYTDSNDIIIISGILNTKKILQIATSYYETTDPKNVYFVGNKIDMKDLFIEKNNVPDLLFNKKYANPISTIHPNYCQKAISTLKIHLEQKIDYLKQNCKPNENTFSDFSSSCADTNSSEEMFLMALSSDNSLDY